MEKILEKLDFTPSKYQEGIFNFIIHGSGNAVIKARAGSGKTKTIVTAMQLVKGTESCLFIAFNKSIVKELSEKLKGYSNCVVKTVHSLGFSICAQNLREKSIEVDDYKYRNSLKQSLSGDSDFESLSDNDKSEYLTNILELLSFSRANLCQSEREIERIADKYTIKAGKKEVEKVLSLMKWGKEHCETVDYMDMVWLPYEMSMNPYSNRFDWIFCDECQDFTEAYVNLFTRCFKRGTRFVAVGDDKQAINQFSGSSETAFRHMCDMPNTRVFSLPISYRCDKAIINVARELVPDIEPRPGAGKGKILYDCSLSILRDGDMVLSRSKAPLSKAYSRLLRRGVNCYIKGGDLGEELIRKVCDYDCTNLGQDLDSDGLFLRMYESMLEDRNDLIERRGLDIWDACLSSRILATYDAISTLITISAGLRTKDDLIRRLQGIFKENSDGVCLSTIHKAKGLEADRVFILCKSTLPPKRVERKWQKEQEDNLVYVAVTRAKNMLGFISEDEIPPYGATMSEDALVNDICAIERRVCNVLGTTPYEFSPKEKAETDAGAEQKKPSLDDLILSL